MTMKIISFSKKLLCEFNVEYIVKIYVTIKLINDFDEFWIHLCNINI
jgi:hypothetical protein